MKIAKECNLSDQEIIQVLIPFAEYLETVKDFSNGMKMAEEAVDVCKRLTKQNDDSFMLDLCNALIILGKIQYNLKLYQDAEKSYQESIDIAQDITHSQSNTLQEKINIVLIHLFIQGLDQSTVDSSMELWLQDVADNIEFDKWYFGHFHIDAELWKKQYALFNGIRNLRTGELVKMR